MQSFENAKHGVQMLLADTDAIVAHVENRFADTGMFRMQGLRRNVANLDPFYGFVIVFHGVGDEVAEHFADADAIAAKAWQAPGDAQFDAAFVHGD